MIPHWNILTQSVWAENEYFRLKNYFCALKKFWIIKPNERNLNKFWLVFTCTKYISLLPWILICWLYSQTHAYSWVRVGKNLSHRFPIRNGLKQGDALLPLLFTFAFEYAIRRFQVNQDGLKLSGTHQLLAYADDVNILGGSVHTVKKNAEALVGVTKEIGLEINADKTKYMIMSEIRTQDEVTI